MHYRSKCAAGALLNRANAWKRLGRFAECRIGSFCFVYDKYYLSFQQFPYANRMVIAQYLHR